MHYLAVFLLAIFLVPAFIFHLKSILLVFSYVP